MGIVTSTHKEYDFPFGKVTTFLTFLILGLLQKQNSSDNTGSTKYLQRCTGFALKNFLII